MTFELYLIILLSAIFAVLLIATTSVISDNKEVKELLKQIRGNTMDKTKPVKPANVTAERTRVTKFAYCPVCGKFISSGFKRCDSCGAEIDWSDTE